MSCPASRAGFGRLVSLWEDGYRQTRLTEGVVLGSERAAAETAALIFTSGYVDRMPGSLLDSGRPLTVHIDDLAMNVPGGNTNAYASAFVLITALLGVNTTASWIAEHWLHRRIARA